MGYPVGNGPPVGYPVGSGPPVGYLVGSGPPVGYSVGPGKRQHMHAVQLENAVKLIRPSNLACVAAGPRTRLNPLYTEGLERLRRRLV